MIKNITTFLLLTIGFVFAQSSIPENSTWFGKDHYIEFYGDSLISFIDLNSPLDYYMGELKIYNLEDNKYIFKQKHLDTLDTSINSAFGNPWLIVTLFKIQNDSLHLEATKKEFSKGQIPFKKIEKKFKQSYINREKVFDSSFEFDSLLYEVYPYKLLVTESGDYSLQIATTFQNAPMKTASSLSKQESEKLKRYSQMACPRKKQKWYAMLHIPETKLTFYYKNEKLIFTGKTKPRLFEELCNFLQQICNETFEFDYNKAVYGD